MKKFTYKLLKNYNPDWGNSMKKKEKNAFTTNKSIRALDFEEACEQLKSMYPNRVVVINDDNDKPIPILPTFKKVTSKEDTSD